MRSVVIRSADGKISCGKVFVLDNEDAVSRAQLESLRSKARATGKTATVFQTEIVDSLDDVTFA